MASDKNYLDYICEQLSHIEGISYRYMMGEYILYYKGKVFGGIYDNRFLVKPVKSAVDIMPKVIYETPYPNGKDMLLVENPEDRDFTERLITAMYDELPITEKKGSSAKEK